MAYLWTYMSRGDGALSVRALAKEGAKRLLIIGTGRSPELPSRDLLLAALNEFQVYSRQASNRQKFCEDAKRQFSIDTEPVAHLETAVGTRMWLLLRPALKGQCFVLSG
jgi:ornithine cyclodeaminase/alanine dehydrogenase-like protein (mu-crystallin family)